MKIIVKLCVYLSTNDKTCFFFLNFGKVLLAFALAEKKVYEFSIAKQNTPNQSFIFASLQGITIRPNRQSLFIMTHQISFYGCFSSTLLVALSPGKTAMLHVTIMEEIYREDYGHFKVSL